jgi:hypothetical protein
MFDAMKQTQVASTDRVNNQSISVEHPCTKNNNLITFKGARSSERSFGEIQIQQKFVSIQDIFFRDKSDKRKGQESQG